MATMTSPTNERRHIPDRRLLPSHTTSRSGASTMSSSAGTDYVAGGTSSRSGTSDRSSMEERSGAAKRLNALDWIAMVLLIIGGLNWGAVGLFETDVVARLFGDMSAISRVIYVLVGLSALYSIYTSS